MTLWKNMAVLLSGSAAGQVLTILGLPFLSRLYDPAAFGSLAAVLSVVGMGSVVAHGRYHLAVPVAKRDAEANALFALAVMLSLVLGPIASMIVLIFVGIDATSLSPISFIVIVAVLTIVVSLIDVFAYRRARLRSFVKSAKIAALRPFVTLSVQILAAPLSPFGLVAGAITGAVVSLTVSILDMIASKASISRHLSFRRICVVSRRYSHYPLLGVPQGLLAAVSMNMMPLLLLRFLGTAWAGQYWLAFRLLLAPIAIFNAVYRQAVLRDFGSRNYFEARQLAIKHSFILTIPAGLGCLVLFIWAPALVPWFLGDSWRPAGEFLRWLGFAGAIDVIKVPSICLLQSRNLLRSTLFAELSIFAIRLSAVLYFLIQGDAIAAVVAFSLLGLLSWTLFIFLVLVRRGSVGGRLSL